MSINRTLRKIKEKRISRRAFLKGAGATAGSLLLAGCAPADPEKLAALAGAGAAALDKNRRENGADGNSEDAKSADDDAKSKDCDAKSEDHDSRSKDDDSRSRDDDSRSEDKGCDAGALAPTITKTTYDGANVLVEWTPASAGDHTILISGSDGSSYTPPGPAPVTGTAPFTPRTMPVPAVLNGNVTYVARVCNGTACAPDFPVNSKTATLLHLAYDNTAGQEYAIGAWQQTPAGYQASFRITDPNGTAGVIPDSPLIVSPGTTEAAMGSLAAAKSYDGLMLLKKDGAEAYSLSERTAFPLARLANPTGVSGNGDFNSADGSFKITNMWDGGDGYTYFFAVMTMTGADLSDLYPTLSGNVNTPPYIPYSLYFSIKTPEGSTTIFPAKTFSGALGLNYSGNSDSSQIIKGTQPLDSIPILSFQPNTENDSDFGQVAEFSTASFLQNVLAGNLIMTYAGKFLTNFAFVNNGGNRKILPELQLHTYIR